ncbi:MAG: hypothetical protein ACRCVT_00540 [Leadbetterella sp.]
MAETAAMLQSRNVQFTPYQILQLYMVLGGIPFYLDFVKPGKSVHQVIEELCFTANGILQKEFKLLYHSLFKEADKHILVIEALAKSPYGLNRKQLLEQTKVAAGGSFLRTVENLLDCGFIAEYQSFGKKNKDTRFRLLNFYSIFYLRFMRENLGNQKNTWQRIQEGQVYQSWCGYAFENICLIHVDQICKQLGISGIHKKISSWHFAGNDEVGGAQIDLIIERKDGIIHLFEAKFTQDSFILSKEYATRLRQKKSIFKHVTQSKKMIVNSLLTTYPAVKNGYYLEEVFSEVDMEALF